MCVRGRRKQRDGPNCSFARQLAIEAAQCDAERLDGTERVVEVHCKDVLRNTAELHHDIVHCTHKHRHTYMHTDTHFRLISTCSQSINEYILKLPPQPTRLSVLNNRVGLSE